MRGSIKVAPVTKKAKVRKTENQMERLVSKGYGKFGGRGEGRTGQDKVEE